MRLPLALAFASFLSVPLSANAQDCLSVHLEAGFEVGDLKGEAPADGIVCYDVRVPIGQNMSVEVVSGRNIAVTVPGYYDARADRMFIGGLPGNLEIRVFQLMRAVEPQPFAVRVRFEAPGNG